MLFEGLYPTALYPLGLQDYSVSNNIVSLGVSKRVFLGFSEFSVIKACVHMVKAINCMMLSAYVLS